MLIEIKKLNILNDGYKRRVSLDRMYVNSDNIVSITDYPGATTFLIRENLGSSVSEGKYSLIRLNQGTKVEEIIAFGTAEELYKSLTRSEGKRLLND